MVLGGCRSFLLLVTTYVLNQELRIDASKEKNVLVPKGCTLEPLGRGLE